VHLKSRQRKRSAFVERNLKTGVCTYEASVPAGLAVIWGGIR
jgi:hypothetical protein